MAKNTVSVVGDIDDELDGKTLSEIIEYFQSLAEKHGQDAWFNKEHDYDGGYWINLCRKETDEEEAKREAEQAQWERQRAKEIEVRDRVEYERLKAKYEGEG